MIALQRLQKQRQSFFFFKRRPNKVQGLENVPLNPDRHEEHFCKGGKITASTSMLLDQERWSWLQKVFRDKVTSRPKIGPKDSVEIIEFLAVL